MTTPRRSILAALAAVPAALATSAAASATGTTRPVINPYDRLTRRLGEVRFRLRLHHDHLNPRVARLSREVDRLAAIVEDLVALENTRTQEPTHDV